MTEVELFKRLGVALAVGLLIGVERGWYERGRAEGGRIAGLRTFGLIGVLGALWALLGDRLGPLVIGFGFAGFAALVVMAHWLKTRRYEDYGITTEVAAFVAFALGAVAMEGYLSVAAGLAVLTAILLGLKPELHRLLERMEAAELRAVLKLLLISVVMLPVLPDRGFGPWHALNPYDIWRMVVLIAGISFVGYFAVRILGPSRGVILTALFGGLAASTAVAVSFSRFGRDRPQAQRLLAAGVVAASATMFPRTLLVASLIQPRLFAYLVWPLGVMTVIAYLASLWQWRGSTRTLVGDALELHNPFELRTALQFGLFLALVMLLARALQAWFGETGVYLLSALSGLSDVDPITLSLSRMVPADLGLRTAAHGIVIAAMVNTVVKGALVAFVARGTMGRRVAAAFAATLGVGLLSLVVVPQ